MKAPRPDSITRAMMTGDTTELSMRGKRGAAAKKRNSKKKETLEEYRLRRHINGSLHMMREANEHICPIED